MGIVGAIKSLFDLILLILFVTILLSWVPNINWYNEPFKTLRSFSEIFLSPFRRLIPPIGMIDISPIVAFFVIELVEKALIGLLQSAGF